MGPRAKEPNEDIDKILEAGNEAYSGAEIRARLALAGYVIVHALPPMKEISAPAGYDWGLGRC